MGYELESAIRDALNAMFRVSVSAGDERFANAAVVAIRFKDGEWTVFARTHSRATWHVELAYNQAGNMAWRYAGQGWKGRWHKVPVSRPRSNAGSLACAVLEAVMDEDGAVEANKAAMCCAYAAVLSNYIENDSEAAEAGYVRETAEQAGLTQDMAKDIGLGWVFE